MKVLSNPVGTNLLSLLARSAGTLIRTVGRQGMWVLTGLIRIVLSIVRLGHALFGLGVRVPLLLIRIALGTTMTGPSSTATAGDSKNRDRNAFPKCAHPPL